MPSEETSVVPAELGPVGRGYLSQRTHSVRPSSSRSTEDSAHVDSEVGQATAVVSQAPCSTASAWRRERVRLESAVFGQRRPPYKTGRYRRAVVRSRRREATVRNRDVRRAQSVLAGGCRTHWPQSEVRNGLVYGNTMAFSRLGVDECVAGDSRHVLRGRQDCGRGQRSCWCSGRDFRGRTCGRPGRRGAIRGPPRRRNRRERWFVGSSY
jgi:hypothetical protein